MVEFDYSEAELRALEEALEAVDSVVASRIKGDGCRAMARLVARRARQEAPEVSGALKKSIRVRNASERYRGRLRKGLAARIYMGGRRAAHATLVHYGTVKMPANPFLTRAITADVAGQQQAFVEGCRKAWNIHIPALASGTGGRSSRTFARAVTS